MRESQEDLLDDHKPLNELVKSKIQSFFWSTNTTAVDYLRMFIIPSLIGAIIVSLIVFTVSIPGGAIISVLIAALAWFIHFVVIIYPYVRREEQSKEVRENFHLFMTHFATLALSNVDRMEVFRQLAQEREEYGSIAEEMNRIVILVDTWNLSVDEACLILSKHTPSNLLEGFLERLAHNLGAGQELDDFLLDEQDTIMQTYSTQYIADLDRVKIFSDAYLSFMLSLTFAIIFAVVAPMLTGISPILLVTAILGGFVTTQVLFALLIDTVSPEDYLWYVPEEFESKINSQRKIATIVGVVVTLLWSTLLAFYGWNYGFPTDLPYYPFVALGTIPALVSGLYIMLLEKGIRARDSQYPGFIRGLGATESVRDSSTASVLRDLRTKNFGSLTPPIIRLYRRLKSRTGRDSAWKLFSAETGSYLIQNFSEMYRLGRRFGADTKVIGKIISQNFTEVLKLRERRRQATSTLVGLVYGVVATASFAFFVAVTVTTTLLSFEDQLDNEELNLIDFTGYDMFMIESLVLISIILTAIASSIIIRLGQRRSFAGGLTHFSLILWLSMAAATLVYYMSERIDVLE